jgi:aerobic-type carbon monoxide dehydrogenase small subunit (CoxS/CutS family)
MNSSADVNSVTSVRVSLTVNGRQVSTTVDSRLLLIDFLRASLGLTGTHNGCSYGICGACTVLIDGLAARSCIALTAQLDGVTIETIETVATTEWGRKILETFSECRGLQCGFCTPGIVMSLVELGRRATEVAADEIADFVDGHLCRCTGYAGIRAAFNQVLGVEPL